MAATRQEQFTGTQDVSATHRFDEQRLDDYLAAHIENYEGPLTVRQFKGGQSNPTYQLVTPKQKYVLRRKPSGKLLPSAHAVDREFRIISALYNTDFPVPRPYCLCEDDDIIDTMFYVMDMVEGRIFWDLTLPDESRDSRAAIFDAKNKTLAQLHMLDYEIMGLTDFGKPGNYFARQISRWTKQYQASETERIEAMNKLIEWLPNNIPDDDTTTIVHGDYRLDNMIIHPAESRVIAVLDWELSTLGNPLADFSYHLMSWIMPAGDGNKGLAESDLPALGIPTIEEYTRLYCERTGRDGLGNIDFYLAYNFFRIAGILQGIVGRVRDGTAASEHAEQNAARVRPLAEAGWLYAQKAGAM
ncbi:MAG: phosphotransferase [Parvularculales bacterium]